MVHLVFACYVNCCWLGQKTLDTKYDRKEISFLFHELYSRYYKFSNVVNSKRWETDTGFPYNPWKYNKQNTEVDLHFYLYLRSYVFLLVLTEFCSRPPLRTFLPPGRAQWRVSVHTGTKWLINVLVTFSCH